MRLSTQESSARGGRWKAETSRLAANRANAKKGARIAPRLARRLRHPRLDRAVRVRHARSVRQLHMGAEHIRNIVDGREISQRRDALAVGGPIADEEHARVKG